MTLKTFAHIALAHRDQDLPGEKFQAVHAVVSSP